MSHVFLSRRVNLCQKGIYSDMGNIEKQVSDITGFVQSDKIKGGGGGGGEFEESRKIRELFPWPREI